MAEKKLGDVMIGLIVLIFFIGTFSVMITSFDSQFINTDNYSSNLQLIYNNSSSSYSSGEKESYDNFNNGSFSLVQGSDVDIRGTSDMALMAKNSPGTIRGFINLVGEYLWANKITLTLISSLLIVVVLILSIRFFRPGGM